MAINAEKVEVVIQDVAEFENTQLYKDGTPLSATNLNRPVKTLKKEVNNIHYLIHQLISGEDIPESVPGTKYAINTILKNSEKYYITIEDNVSAEFELRNAAGFQEIIVPGAIGVDLNALVTDNFRGIVEQDLLVDGFASAYSAEIMRGMGGSGFYINRNYNADDGFSAMHRPFTMGSTQFHQHNHPNYYRMIGLGEQTAIVNGYYVRTTHNDPRLITGSGVELNAPPIPAEVLATNRCYNGWY